MNQNYQWSFSICKSLSGFSTR